MVDCKKNDTAQSKNKRLLEIAMQYQTTLGWSLITSGLTTLLLKVIPGNSLWWGIALLIAGGTILYLKKNSDVINSTK